MIKKHTGTDNAYHFTAQAKSGATLLTSISFSDPTEMDATIKSLECLPMTRNHFERVTNTEGKFLFNVQDDNGRTIGRSEPYDSEAGMENGIKNLRNNFQSPS